MEKHGIEIKAGFEGRTVLEALQEQGVYILAPCGGKGTCGKCRVRFLTGAPEPSEADKKVLSEDALARGERLACKVKAQEGMCVEAAAPDENAMEVETSFSISGSLPAGTAGAFEDAESGGMVGINGKAGMTEMAEGIVAAVDIGTTTIAMSSTAISPIAISSQGAGGRVLRTVTGINHQRAYGADVISRIDASNRGKGAALQECILGDLAKLRAQLCLPEDVQMIVSGNSTMEHLLQNLPCQTLGVAPYTSVDISLHRYENMLILPGISTFVGADIVSGIVACGMDQNDEICILVDLGTNGEMAIGNRDRIVSASTAAGPAFEGGNISCGVAGIPGAISGVEIEDKKARIRTIGDKAPVGLCGTGVLEVMYELLKAEIVDETGLMDDEYADDGFPLAEGIVFTAKDIREVQLAKAAVRAGMEVLLQEFGADYDQVGKLYLAGGFGQKIDLVKAVGIGLLPKELLGKIQAVGNSSLAGAVMAAQDPEVLRRMEHVAATAQETALAENPRFSDLYMEHMFFPEEE